jgi:hypothetical protein
MPERTKVPGSGGFSGGAAYRNRTDDLRIRGTRDLAAHALPAPMALVIALMALAALGLSGNPVHKPVHEQEAVARPSKRLNAPGPRGSGAFNGSGLWPSRLLLSHGLGVRALRVAQVDPFAGGADGAAAARGGELDQAGALLTGLHLGAQVRCRGLRRLLWTAWGRRDHGLRLGVCGLGFAACGRDSLSATVPTWTSSMSACYVIHGHPVRIP